jgi:hypothetical protein
VAWLRVDTQTILTIASHVITKNHRIGVTHSDHRTWYLHIRDMRESDRGWYMCQINTDPMKSQVGYLEVVGKCLCTHAVTAGGYEKVATSQSVVDGGKTCPQHVRANFALGQTMKAQRGSTEIALLFL